MVVCIFNKEKCGLFSVDLQIISFIVGDDLSEAALAVPGIDAVMEHQRKRLEDRSRAVAMVAHVREKLTDTQFRRLWMYLSLIHISSL